MASRIIRPIVIQAFNQGGVADSKYSGIASSNARLVGWDIHSKPGLLQVNQAMGKISSSTITEFCKNKVACSNGIRYWFSATSGKIWQEKAGAFTLVYTIAPNAGAVAILGAREYAGFIYFFTQSRAHRIPIDGTKADGAAAWTANAVPNWAELNLDQATLGGTGATAYTLATSIGETATAKQTFIVVNNIIESVRLKVIAKGTGDWTVTIHDSSNNVITSKTITAASMANGLMYFTFATPVVVTPGLTYHVHVVSTVADGTVDTGVNSDLEASQMSIFTTSDDTYHPTKEVNLVLYVGDKQFVHQIDASTRGSDAVFSLAALDVPVGYRVSALGKMDTNLLVGTIISTSVSRCEIFNWNTYGQSFLSSDTVYEPGINSFLETDNFVIVNAGLAGNLYSYNGANLVFYKKIPGTYSPTAQAIIYPEATDLFNGFLPIFGVSNVQGDPCDQGIWSMGKYSNNYPTVLNLEYPTSNLDGSNYNILAGIQIGAVVVVGQDVYMSWSYNGTYGVDKLDYSNKILHPILETRSIDPFLSGLTTFSEFIVTYEDTMPAGVSLLFKYGKNGAVATSGTDLVTQVDSDRNRINVDASRLDARTLQLRMEATTNGNAGPKIQAIIIVFEGVNVAF